MQIIIGAKFLAGYCSISYFFHVVILKVLIGGWSSLGELNDGLTFFLVVFPLGILLWSRVWSVVLALYQSMWLIAVTVPVFIRPIFESDIGKAVGENELIFFRIFFVVHFIGLGLVVSYAVQRSNLAFKRDALKRAP